MRLNLCPTTSPDCFSIQFEQQSKRCPLYSIVPLFFCRRKSYSVYSDGWVIIIDVDSRTAQDKKSHRGACSGHLSYNFRISFRAAVHAPVAGRDIELSRTLMVVNHVEWIWLMMGALMCGVGWPLWHDDEKEEGMRRMRRRRKMRMLMLVCWFSTRLGHLIQGCGP